MGKKRSRLPADLTAGARGVNRWRERRKRPGRMPEDLWSECVALARVHGVNAVARALRLDYYSLKRRVEASSRRSRVSPPVPVFVEARVPPAPLSAECVFELENPGGGKMTVRVCGPIDVVTLAEALWRASSCSR